MSTSSISIPTLASCRFRFLQNPHQVVVYIVSGTGGLHVVRRELTACFAAIFGVVQQFSAPAPSRADALYVCDIRHHRTVDADELLTALDPEQRAVALARSGPVCVLAGAGTGKTRAITHRIAYAVATGVVNPAQVLALTFTVRAAGELRGRLRALGGGAAAVRATTFHAAALRQLTYFWPRVIGGRAPRLVESKLPLLRESARDLGLRVEGPALSEAVTEIEWAKVCQVHPDSYVFAATEAKRAPSAGVEDTGRLYAAYEALRRDRQLIDFESVLELTAAILLTEPVVAREVHAAFRYFTVDEFQDVNPLQKLLLDAWLGGREEVCVVGDPRQTIYSFTGATSEYLRTFTVDYPTATMVRLVRDYRSTPQVVGVANRLVAGPASAAAPAGGADSGALVAQRPPGPEPVVTRYANEEAEAAGVAAAITALMRSGVPPNEIAVLLRINAHMERFERALSDGGVPYVVRGAERFYDRPEVRQALVLLRGAPGRRARAPTPRGCQASWPPPSGTCLRRPGSPPRRPPRAAGSGNAGSPSPPSPGSRTTWPPRGPRRPWRSSPPSWPSARRAGTRRSRPP